MEKEVKELRTLLRKILYKSNLEYCGSADDLQDRLTDIHEMIAEEYPELKEKEN